MASKNLQFASREEAMKLRNEALAKVADTLEKCIDEYEFLSKMEFEIVEDPTRPSSAIEKADEEPHQAEESAQEKASNEVRADQADQKDDKEDDLRDDADEKSDRSSDEDIDQDEEDSDEYVQKGYDYFLSKLHERGLMKSDKQGLKTWPQHGDGESMVKSEGPSSQQSAALTQSSPNTQLIDKTEALAKSFDARIDGLTKIVGELSDAFNKFASAPAAPRKGVAGYQPLRKADGGGEEKSLTKSQVIEGLLKAQQKGDRRVDPALVAKVELGRASASDFEYIAQILG
jgi:hypothetical protein